MNTNEITRLLLNDDFVAPVYGGTLASDELPTRIVNYPICFCVNTAPKANPGEHWIALYLQQRGYVEVFCSFGSSPAMHVTLTNLRKFHKTFGFQKLTYNNHCLQTVLSSLCGMYAILYLQIKCRGYSIAELTFCFTSDAMLNDKIVEKLYKAV